MLSAGNNELVNTAMASSLLSTASRSRGHRASLAGLGRRISRTARRSAAHARYRPRPPFAATSRHTVDGARPSRRAISLTGSPAASPREISSRSASDSRNGDRRGSASADGAAPQPLAGSHTGTG